MYLLATCISSETHLFNSLVYLLIDLFFCCLVFCALYIISIDAEKSLNNIQHPFIIKAWRKNSMVLAQKQTGRPVEQNRGSRYEATQL
jgi:hypothetical protein